MASTLKSPLAIPLRQPQRISAFPPRSRLPRLETTCERISFAGHPGLPLIDVRFTACRLHDKGFYIDVCDFAEQVIERWSVPELPLPNAVNAIERAVCGETYPAKKACHLRDLFAIHVGHLADNGVIVAPRGNFYCGSSAYVVDTRSTQAFVFPDGYDDDLHFYSATGGFTPDGKSWLYVRWPFQDTFDILDGKRTGARCELGRLDLETFDTKALYELDNDDKVHQVTASPDGRYVIFACIQNDLYVPYPDAPIEEDPEGFRRSHDGGIRL